MNYEPIVFNSYEERKNCLFKTLAPDLSQDCVNYLSINGFLTAPASTKYHGVYAGGLFDHSMNVRKVLLDLTQELGLKWLRPESPTIIAILHDLCKIDQYEYDIRSESYTYSNKPIIKGHGVKSIVYAQKTMSLTPEEIACIYHHMGAFEKEDWQGYTQAVTDYPNVLWTHTADMVASQIMEVRK